MKPLKKLSKQAEENYKALPPPGDERREILRLRQEILDLKAEKASEHIIGGAQLDRLRNMQVENEIGQHFDQAGNVPVKNADPDYHYAWIEYNRPLANPGQQVDQLLAEPWGWEVVHGDMPEAANKKTATGSRMVGGAMLLRLRLDRYWMRQMDLQKRTAENTGNPMDASASVEELASKFPGMFVAHTSLEDPLVQRLIKTTVAKGRAAEEFTHMLNEGSIPIADATRFGAVAGGTRRAA